MPKSDQLERAVTNPAKTVRKLAARADDADRKALLEQFATELEAWENRLNNNFQSALGLTELHLTERLDELEKLLRRHLVKVGDDGTAGQ